MVSLKKQSFPDPTGKKRYMMPSAITFPFNQTRQFEMDLARSLGLGTDVHRGEILRYRCIDACGCWKSASFWQKMYRAETHFSLVCISGYGETQSVRYISHPVICATCIALLGAILFLDQEKAFDRVDHQFLLKTLKHLNLGDNFISWTEIILKDISSQIKINGFLSDDILIGRE